MPDFNLKTALKAIDQRRKDNPPKVIVRQIDPGSPQERIARARQQEAALLDEMEWLKQEPDSDVKTHRMDAMLDRLGELAAEQGDYKRAVSITKTPQRRKYYEGIAKAIKKKNDATCQCPDDRLVDHANKTEFTAPSTITVDRIVGTNGELLNLNVCSKCGFKNAKP